MQRKVSHAATSAYRSASHKRQEGVLRDCDRTEMAIVDAADSCMTGIMQDWRRGTLTAFGVENRLRAFDYDCERIVDRALLVGARDWWRSAVMLWAVAAEKEPALVAAIALSPRGGIREDAAGTFGLLLQIMDAPSASDVIAIISAPVNGKSWRERLRDMTSQRVSPTRVAKAVAEAYSAGGNVKDVERALKPIVGKKSAAARTIARTESLRVADRMHEESMAQAGDAVLGYTYNATLDDVVRPEHAARHGRVFKKDQQRIEVPDGPNCRCWYSPIIAADVRVFGRPGSLPPEASKVREFAKWFDSQTPYRREKIIGKDVFKEAMEMHGTGEPTWEQVASASPWIETERLRGDLERRAERASSQRRAPRG